MEAYNAVAGLKQQASNLSKMMRTDFGRNMSRSEALERIAKIHGYDNWDTAAGCVVRLAQATQQGVLSPEAQIAQLMALDAGLVGNLTFRHIVDRLAEQPNSTAAAAWQRVSNVKDMVSVRPINEVLAETGLFDHDVLLIVGMVACTTSISPGIRLAVECLKMTSVH